MLLGSFFHGTINLFYCVTVCINWGCWNEGLIIGGLMKCTCYRLMHIFYLTKVLILSWIERLTSLTISLLNVVNFSKVYWEQSMNWAFCVLCSYSPCCCMQCVVCNVGHCYSDYI